MEFLPLLDANFFRDISHSGVGGGGRGERGCRVDGSGSVGAVETAVAAVATR